MKPISFKRHWFPVYVICQAVWLYFRFSLSFREVEVWIGVEIALSADQQPRVSRSEVLDLPR